MVGGLLVQDRDAESEDRAQMKVVTQRAPTEAEWGDLLFAWRVAKHVKSNAIVIARDLATVGVGAGQMSRVDSVRLAIEKAQTPVAGAALASDAFFPFADGPEAAIERRRDGDRPARRLDPRRRGVRRRRRGRRRDGRHRAAPLPPLMPAWELSIDVDAPPDAAWALVGDPTSVPRWYPKYAAAEVDGDPRVLRTAEGGELRRAAARPRRRRPPYSYSVLSGAPVSSHRAGFAVTAEGGGSRITWWTDAEPSDPAADLQGRLTPTQTDALRRMKEILEGG